MNSINQNLTFIPKFSLYQILPGIFLIEIDGNEDLAMTFLRAQEFYESGNTNFQGNVFTLQQYKDWYKTQSKTGEFTYGEDWRGFNIPSHAIKECYEKHMERLDTDLFFLDICRIADELTKQNGRQAYYLLGVRAGDVKTLDHEIAHGLFTTNPVYRDKMVKLIEALPLTVTAYLTDYLINLGYAQSVVFDEIQAYMSTGLRGDMDETLLNPYMRDFSLIFNQFAAEEQPNPIPILSKE